MTYEKFEAFITKYQNIIKNSSELYQNYKVDLINYEEPYNEIISILQNNLFTKEASEWIDWYIFDRISFSGGENEANDSDGNRICFDTQSLYNYLVKINGIKSFLV